MAIGAAGDSLRENRSPNCKRHRINRIIRIVVENAGNPGAIRPMSKVVTSGLSGDMIGSVSSSSVAIGIDSGRNAAGYRPVSPSEITRGFADP